MALIHGLANVRFYGFILRQALHELYLVLE
jgi:hypothetical protein